ncbi:GNAT family N-acetyltransferase [Nocardioides taihuensis]|uniref:GNAT family N-acetyltransferase n=1 Tax=Nocardioides taihuensis TaxID=1835606 RepID=A0ABW0BJ80_9ACTN
MHFDFIEHQRPPGPAYLWRPFGDGRRSDPNFNARWWSERNFLDTSRLLSVEVNGVELARIEIDRVPHLASSQGASHLGLVREIHYLEVSRAHVGQGLGTEIVGWLEAEFSDARLIASTDSAVGFWASLGGWELVDHADGIRGDWALYVSRPVA